MYPWVSGPETGGAGFSVSILKTSRLSIYIDLDGTVVFKTTADGGVDRPIKFDSGVAPIEFTGGSIIADTVHDVIGSSPGIPLTLKEIGGLEVKINVLGDVNIPGEVLASVVKAQPTENLLVVNNAGVGLIIANATGQATFGSTVVAPALKSPFLIGPTGGDLVLLDEFSGFKLTLKGSSGLVEVEKSLSVLETATVTGLTTLDGGVVTDDVKSNAAADLNLTENGGSGLHVANTTGIVTADAAVVGETFKSPDTLPLNLTNWQDLGLTVADTTGAVTLSETLTVKSTVYGSVGSGLVLRNDSTNNVGVSIAAVTGDVKVDSDLDVVGAASIGPTAITPSIALAVSAAGADKAILLPHVSDPVNVVTPVAGMLVYNTSLTTFQVYNGSIWQTLAVV
jgi:hypothetical protein